MSIKILDCTLRDGGYINDWNFSNKQIGSILSALENSGLDVIECGYLNDKNGKKSNSTLFDSCSAVDVFLKEDAADKVVMINLGDFNIENLPPKKETKIDGIRLAFHKKDIVLAIESAKHIISLGYKLYFQPMVTKNYQDIEFLSLIYQTNQMDICAFYIVDSFGSMTLEEFQHYMILADNNLEEDILLGYHSHNNMQLAFSNAINMCGTRLRRDIIVDASIYGIGRGAGNLNSELIADYLNKAFKKTYDTLPLLEIIDEFLSQLMAKKSWGFSPAQYLSASFNCHPNYATYLINKNTKHIVAVRKILEKLSDDKKSSFDRAHIEELYISSLLEIKTEVKGSLFIPTGKRVVLLASGKSLEDYQPSIEGKLQSNEYITIALNHKPKYECDYYFFSNQKRFDEFKSMLPNDKMIITSNLVSDMESKTVLDFKEFVFIDTKVVTNVAMVAINYLISKGLSQVEIAGLDGYKINEDNYSYKETNIISDNRELGVQNKIIQESLEKLSRQIDIVFLTPSIFK